MAGLVWLVGLVAVLKPYMDPRGQSAVVLGIMLLINAVSADSPVADVSLFGSTYHAEEYIDGISSPRRLSSSLSPTSHTAAFEDLDILSTHQELNKAELPHESFTPTGLDAEAKEPQPLLPSLHSSQLVSQLQPQSNLSRLRLSQEVAKDAQRSESEKIFTTASSLPFETLGFSDPPSDEAYILDHVLLDHELPVKNSSKIQHVNQLSPSGAPMQENKPETIVPNSHEILAPSYHVPFIGLHLQSPSSEPTEAPPEDFYPSNTLDFDWGSGDYLETMAFLSPEEDYSLVTRVPDTYDQEDNSEQYDTAFPSRVGTTFSSLHHLRILPSSSPMAAHAEHLPLTSINLSSFSSLHPTVHYTLEVTPTISSEVVEASDADWSDTYSIQPTDVLLPDMNSLEYYTTQLTKESAGSGSEAEQRGNITVVPISTSDTTPTNSIANDTKVTEDDTDRDLSGFEPHSKTAVIETTELFNVSKPFLEHSFVMTPLLELSSPMWATEIFTTDWSAGSHTAGLRSSAVILPSPTDFWSDDVLSSFSLTDVQWFVTESLPQSTIDSTPVITATAAPSSSPTENPSITTVHVFNVTSMSFNGTLMPPVMLGDQGVTTDEFDNPATMTLIPANSDANITPLIPTSPNANTSFHQETTGLGVTVTTVASGERQNTTLASRRYLCNLEKPEYLIKIGFPSGVTVGRAKSQVEQILKQEFSELIELQVIEPPPNFVFRVVSGPVVYTAISVINALRRSGRRFLSVSPNWVIPDSKYQVHTVLQFVPGHIDVRFCNFSESVERGLTMAFAEVRRRAKSSADFTVQITNVTMAVPKNQQRHLGRYPVEITFTVRNSRGYLMGSEVSNALMTLAKVEFSYYMGFPVFQIAEPFHYPELNTSQFLRSSWLRTVVLGVLDSDVGQRTFQANIERRVALLLGEAMGLVRRVKRATSVGNSSVQVVSMNQLVGTDHPLEVVYFVEGPDGQRVPAGEIANILNSMDVQKAAIILGYRVQGILAQPVEKVPSSPSDTENPNMWLIIGVVIPLLVVIIIISILYWKLCRTDKLEFQPDAMASMQQRQKLQAPSVKGFDFAKLHLGQQNKDDVMVVQESIPAGPLPVSDKEGPSPSQNGEGPLPTSKTSASSTKASRSSRRRERISPSDGDSMVSDRSSGKESTEESLRAQATPGDSKQTRKVPINVLNGKNKIGPPPTNSLNEQFSSTSIFEHVDRMSRATDVSRRPPNKVQLIAMQPMSVPPLHSHTADTNHINKEIQVALRQKSEIEHHRNKIRLRAKRKGHYDFPAMDDVDCSLGDAKDQDHIYQKAQMQMDKILDQHAQIFVEPRKSAQGRHSSKQLMKEQSNGGMMDADKDHLISEDTDPVYRKCPGVNNVAFVSDPDQATHGGPSPTDDVFLVPFSSPPGHAPPPPPYMPPQPSIEEARQQMHSLLDDAFALVSPTSQGSSAGVTLPGVSVNPSDLSPPGRGHRSWGPSYQGLGPYTGRFNDLSVSPPLVQGPIPRQDRGLSYLPPGEAAGPGEQVQIASLYSSRGLYADDLPTSARPRPVGGTTGGQLHHLTQVGLSSRVNGYPAGVRGHPGQNGGISWSNYQDDNYCRAVPDNTAMPRGVHREPSAPPTHLDTGLDYLSAPLPMATTPPTQSSASLIKAIREELLRLSQKQGSLSSYHS